MRRWKWIKKYLKNIAKGYNYSPDGWDCRKEVIWQEFLRHLKERMNDPNPRKSVSRKR